MAQHPEWTLRAEMVYHGEYDTNWAVLYDKEGKEIRRYNAHHLITVQWAKE